MRKQRHTSMVALPPAIEGIPAAGISHRQIADELSQFMLS